MSIRAVGTCVIGVGRRNVADSIIGVTVSVQSTVTVLIIDTLEVVGAVGGRAAGQARKQDLMPTAMPSQASAAGAVAPASQEWP